MESNPFRVIPLLSFSSPCRGIILFRYRESSRRQQILKKPVYGFDGFWNTCIRILEFNMCCIKVYSTIELLGDNWIIVVIFILMSIGFWAQVAVLLM